MWDLIAHLPGDTYGRTGVLPVPDCGQRRLRGPVPPEPSRVTVAKVTRVTVKVTRVTVATSRVTPRSTLGPAIAAVRAI